MITFNESQYRNLVVIKAGLEGMLAHSPRELEQIYIQLLELMVEVEDAPMV